MITFLCGLAFLLVGGLIYGRVVERVFKPTDAETPAIKRNDGVDFVPMKKWKNSLVELLNIAGTGPILGPIQGILFGPIAFITIPIGCVIAGAFHDFMIGMISVRHDGAQTPKLVGRFLGKYFHAIYMFFVCLTLLLVGVVFIYTPGDIFVSQVLDEGSSAANPMLWVVYGVIFLYFIIATLLPIDKVIGRIYPIFGAILLISAVGVFIGLFTNNYPLVEIWNASATTFPLKGNFIPLFFVTVACGICSGFHSTQVTLVSRTITNEHEGRTTFYDMMLLEGFIAMIWAAAGMGALQSGLTDADTLYNFPAQVVGIVSKDMLGSVGGFIAIIGIIVLPITSGDTALRSLRLILGDAVNLDQTKKKNALILALIIFSVTGGLLIWSKTNPEGFHILWQYFSWTNEVIAVFSFAFITIYMKQHKLPYILSLLPGCFYMYTVSAYILNAHIGLNLSWTATYIIAGVITLIFALALMLYNNKPKELKTA